MGERMNISDRYLECDDCNILYKGDCPVHGPLLWIKDSAVRSRARTSLPNGLYLMPSAMGQGGLGVFAKNEVERRVIFGPYEGQIIPLIGSKCIVDKTYAWDILKEDQAHHLVDGRDEQQGNWMRFVNCAHREQEQNLVAFQYCDEIYFRTCKTIDAGTELLVWFHDKYFWRLKDVAYFMTLGKGVKFRCVRCGLFFAGPSYLFKHKKFRCRAESIARASDPINDVTTVCHSEKVSSLANQNSKGGPEQCNVIIQSAMFVTHQGTQTDEDILEVVLQQEKSIPHEEADVQMLSHTPQVAAGAAKAGVSMVSPDSRPLTSNVTYIIENRAPDGQEANVVIGKGVFSPTNTNSSTMHLPNSPDATSSEGPRLGNVIYHSLNQNDVGVIHQPAPQASARALDCVSNGETVVSTLNNAGVVHRPPERVPSSETVVPALRRSINSSAMERGPIISQAPPQISPTLTSPSQSGNPVPLEQVRYVANGADALCSPGVPPDKTNASVIPSAPQGVFISNGPRQVNPTTIFVSPVVGQVPQQQKLANATPIRISDQVVRNIINTILPLHEGHQYLQRTQQVTAISTTPTTVSLAPHTLQVQVPAAHVARTAPSVSAANVTLQAVPLGHKPKQLNTVLVAPWEHDQRASGSQTGEQGGEVRQMYPCEYCGKVFKYVSKLKEHEPTHTGEKPFQCKECGKCFTQKGTLKDHLRLHSGEKPFKCEVCGEAFTWKIQLRVHRSTHTGDEPYKCELCGKAFAVKQYLTVHQRSHPGYEKPFKCDECDKGFSQKAHLVTHKRTHAKDELTCQDCDKCFTQREHLETHRRLHTGEKPYKCGNCGECFAVNSDLILHSRRHNADDRPTQCPDCGKGFSRVAAYTIHQRIHSGEKPFKCKECRKRFISNTRLVVHQRWHLGSESEDSTKCNGQASAEGQADQTPHKCPTCSKCFAKMASLIDHQRSHNVENTPAAPMDIEQTAVNGNETEYRCAHTDQMSLDNEEAPAQIESTPLQKSRRAVSVNHIKETPMHVEETPLPNEQTSSDKTVQRQPLRDHAPVSNNNKNKKQRIDSENDIVVAPASNVEIPVSGEQAPVDMKELPRITPGQRNTDRTEHQETDNAVAAVKADRTEHQETSSQLAAVKANSTEHQETSSQLAAVKADRTEHQETNSQLAAVKADRTEHQETDNAVAAVKADRTEQKETGSELAAVKADRTEHQETNSELAAVKADRTEHQETSSQLAAVKADRTEHQETSSELAAVNADTTEHQETNNAVAAVKADRTEQKETDNVVAAVKADSTEQKETGSELAADKADRTEHQETDNAVAAVKADSIEQKETGSELATVKADRTEHQETSSELAAAKSPLSVKPR